MVEWKSLNSENGEAYKKIFQNFDNYEKIKTLNWNKLSPTVGLLTNFVTRHLLPGNILTTIRQKHKGSTQWRAALLATVVLP
jgi:hypothetical protein